MVFECPTVYQVPLDAGTDGMNFKRPEAIPASVYRNVFVPQNFR
ncbi:hypothetical protein At15955_51070 (plasmid) [Agrobacterium tumefaciens]|nr:hypothetical protein Ach5_49460 [Agrobacterium tumefaciens]AYM20092.1 hypothetical protein At15955_51070 [Agrobacterium tumefaciens]AYM71395.1 hypothetical protein AtA6_51790 [Agrobacterium tumefaciens]CUX05009.1 hypothetical protein AGR1C_pAt20070 [Agrobacterium fabacearum TT111]